jgi:hypothetical protein
VATPSPAERRPVPAQVAADAIDAAYPTDAIDASPPAPAVRPPDPPLPPSGDADETIAALRARIATLVERSRAKKPTPPPPPVVGDASPLPFDVVERDEGTLHRRVLHHPPGSRVGRVELAPARRVSSRGLAFLALDPTLAEADPAGALYVDTETTGLAGGTGTVPFLVGLAWFEDDALVVEQLLLRRFGEEAPLLARLAERLSAATMVVSFNGKAFDLPLLRTRCVMNRVPPPPVRPHLDLVHVARRVHRAARGEVATPGDRDGPWIERDDALDGSRARVTSCKLVALERALLGFQRIDDVPSAEIPARYAHFVRTSDGDAIRGVCDHNLLDVISMAALVATYGGVVDRLAAAEATPLDREATSLGGADLVGLAGTLARAGALPLARRAADEAVGRAEAGEGGRELSRAALRARGRIAKKAADVPTMLADFEALAGAHDDPEARLELAKAYEHKLRDVERALELVAAGTSEDAPRAAHRRARLERKSDQARQVALPVAGAPHREVGRRRR